jgi:hypothetical protein
MEVHKKRTLYIFHALELSDHFFSACSVICLQFENRTKTHHSIEKILFCRTDKFLRGCHRQNDSLLAVSRSTGTFRERMVAI